MFLILQKFITNLIRKPRVNIKVITIIHRRIGRSILHNMNDNNQPGTSQNTYGDDSSQESDSGADNNKHPKHLKGKQIGLFYARRGAREKRKMNNMTPERREMMFQERREKKARRQALADLRPLGTILLSDKRKIEIRKMLNRTSSSMENLFITTDNSYAHVEDSYFKRDFLSIVNGNIMEKIGQKEMILVQDPRIDEAFYNHLKGKLTDTTYFNMLKQRSRLPAMSMSEDIVKLVEENQVVVISGETGCGKTTQVAQFILDNYIENKRSSICNIVCTQPRRISAISVAERVAAERAERLGLSVGYQIRLEKKPPRERGSILFCTTGVLLKQMESDPSLSKVSHVILDEIHERDINSDFLIAILKELINHRKDLKVILMSATLNSDAFSKYYNNAPHINIPGFTYPVQEYFLEDVLQKTGFTFPEDNRPKWIRRKDRKKEAENIDEFGGVIVPYVRDIEAQGKYSRSVCEQLRNPISEKLNLELILELLVDICQQEKEEGAILVFVSGYVEISTLISNMDKSGKFPRRKYNIIPLHSQLPTVEQKQIFQPSPPGIRKIVVSTNIAETSITIDDVVFVIDCGKIKISSYDVETNTEILAQEWVSLANASQRRGRAGRVKPGVCFHLYTRARGMVLEKFLKPEVLRSRLENVILQAKILQLGKVEPFFARLLDMPDPKAVKAALELLVRLNALTEDEQLTPLGYHLAKLPIGPQMGKMVLFGAIFSCLDPVLSVAASLDFKDAFQLPLDNNIKAADERRHELGAGWQSDHILLHNALELFETTSNQRQFCREYYLSFSTLKLLRDLKGQFMQYLLDLNFVPCLDPKNPVNNMNSNNKSLVKAIICAGLYPNVAIVTQKKTRYQVRSLDHESLKLHPKSILYKERSFDSPLLVYFLKLKSSSVFLHDATVVQPLPIVFFGDNYEHTIVNGHHNISVNKKLKFKCTQSTADLIKDLRLRLNWFLEHKVAHPGVVYWNDDTNEIKVLKAIMELITSEDVGDLDLDHYDDYD